MNPAIFEETMKHTSSFVRNIRCSVTVGSVVLSAASLVAACSDDPNAHGSQPVEVNNVGGSAGTTHTDPKPDAAAAGSGGSVVETPDAQAGDASADTGPSSRQDGDAAGDANQTGDGASDAGEVWAALCKDNAGSPLAYDFSRGLAGEYAFELSMNCDLGGYMAPLVEADPINLTKVDEYVGELTDWYRATVLRCGDEGVTPAPNRYGLVPSSQAKGMSNADFLATIGLFLSVVDRHDGQPDGMSAKDKAEIRRRLMSFHDRAVEKATAEFTRPSNTPDCIPSPAADGGTSG